MWARDFPGSERLRWDHRQYYKERWLLKGIHILCVSHCTTCTCWKSPHSNYMQVYKQKIPTADPSNIRPWNAPYVKMWVRWFPKRIKHKEQRRIYVYSIGDHLTHMSQNTWSPELTVSNALRAGRSFSDSSGVTRSIRSRLSGNFTFLPTLHCTCVAPQSHTSRVANNHRHSLGMGILHVNKTKFGY